MSDDDADDDPLESIGTPKCPRCLVLMELTGSGRGVWRCPECGLASF